MTNTEYAKRRKMPLSTDKNDPVDVSQIIIKCDESNLTVARYCNRITIAIAHDGTIDVMDAIDNMINMICRLGIDRVVTCLTMVVTPHIRYDVHPVTLSGTVWNINCQSVAQIAMALNQIGVKLAPG